jgi:hypothetical protein
MFRTEMPVHIYYIIEIGLNSLLSSGDGRKKLNFLFGILTHIAEIPKCDLWVHDAYVDLKEQ